MPRPSDTPFDWASDGVHSDPGEVWDGQPSVAVPSAGQIAAGFRPGEKVPAEWLNEIVRRNSAWLTFLQELTAPREIVIPGGAFQIAPDSGGSAELLRQDGAAWATPAGISGFRGQVLYLPDGLSGSPQRAWLDLSPYLHMAPMTLNSIRITGRAADAVVLEARLVRRDPLSAPTVTLLETVTSAASAPAANFDTGFVGPFLIDPLDGGTTNELELTFDAGSITGRLVLFDVTLVVAP